MYCIYCIYICVLYYLPGAEIKLKFKVSASGEIIFCERFYQAKKGIILNINQSI